MERMNFYETLYKKAPECADSGDLSDDCDILNDFFIDNEETIAKFGFEELFDSERQLISFSSQDVDETSQILLPPEGRGLIHIKCLGDRNCLYNSVSMLLIGDNRLSTELRLKNVGSLILNREKFGIAKFQNYAAAKGFEEDVLHQLQKGVYSSLRHIASLVLTLKVDITSIYPKIDNPCVRRNDLNFTFKAKDGMNLDNCLLTIMWTHMTNTNLKMWTPNHFVPCIRSIRKTTPAKKITTVQFGSKRSVSDFFSNCKKKQTGAESPEITKKENLIGKKRGKKAKPVKWKNMALLLASFFHNSLVSKFII